MNQISCVGEVPSPPLPFAGGEPTADPDASSIEIGVVEDRALYRECLVHTLTSASDQPLIIHSFSTLEQAASVCRPPLRLLIVCLHNRLIEDAMATIEMANGQGVRTLILADGIGQDLALTLRSALRRGLSGFMLAHESGFRLLESVIPFLLNGGIYLPPEFLFESASRPAVDASPNKGVLTIRQRQVLQQIAAGKSNKAISSELEMSESTVKVHIGAIMKKLGAKNRTEAAILAQSLPMQDD